MKEKWRFISGRDYSPEMNMAIDEAILTLHSEGKVPPTIRFYTWKPASLSIGYFQKVEQEVNQEQVEAHGLGLVRRATGGRAVLHDQELTYSVIVSEDHPRMPVSVIDAYQVISMGLLHGFRKLGLQAEMAKLETEEQQQKQRKPESSVCFDAPSWYELLVEGKKVAGSAQTRQKGTILQHGSILLDIDVDMLYDVLRFPSEELKQKLKASFSQKAVAINQLRKMPVVVAEAEAAFYHGFSKGMEIEMIPDGLTAEERALAEKLAKERYGNPDWTYKR